MSTAYSDPNSDVAYTWTDDGANDYQRVDDAVRSPTNAATGGDGNYCDAGPNDDNEEAAFGMSEPSISGTVSSAKLYAYMECSSGTNTVEIRIKVNGSWQTAGSHSVSSRAWYSTDFTAGWSAASFYPLQIGIKPLTISKGVDVYVYAAYVELTYTPAGGGTIHSRQTGDLLAVSQSLSDSSITLRFISDAISVSNISLQFVPTVFGRLVQEPIGSGDDLMRTADLQRVVSETAAISDLCRLGAQQNRMIGDFLGVRDIRSRQSFTSRILMDALELDDRPAYEAIWRRALLDPAGLGGTVVRNVDILRSVIKSMVLSEELVRVVDALRALTSVLEANDEFALRCVLGNVLPGDTTFTSRGPGESAFQPIGPGGSCHISRGPGDATVEPKHSGG